MFLVAVAAMAVAAMAVATIMNSIMNSRILLAFSKIESPTSVE